MTLKDGFGLGGKTMFAHPRRNQYFHWGATAPLPPGNSPPHLPAVILYTFVSEHELHRFCTSAMCNYSQLRLSRISGDLTNHFDLDEIRVTVLYTFVCLG